MEGRRNKKRKKDRKEEGIQGERRKEKKKERRSSAGFKLVRLVLLVFLCVKQEGVVERMVSLFSLPEPHSSLLFSSSPVPQGPSAPH